MSVEINRFIGFDPGSSGAIGFVDVFSNNVLGFGYEKMELKSSIEFHNQIHRICSERKKHAVCIEQAGRINQSRNHSFGYGIGFRMGQLQTILELQGRTPGFLEVITWRASLDLKYSSSKEELIEAAQVLFKDNFIPPKCRVPSSDCAEAVLIALASFVLVTQHKAITINNGKTGVIYFRNKISLHNRSKRVSASSRSKSRNASKRIRSNGNSR